MEKGVTFEPYDSVIIGGGLAGLAAAIKLRLHDPNYSVLVLEKSPGQSNSLMAGQRFRAGIANRRDRGSEEMQELLAGRNEGQLTPEMTLFAETAAQELAFWQEQPDFVPVIDRVEWFGPQWGEANHANRGRGRSVIQWMFNAATKVGVDFMFIEAQGLSNVDGVVNGVHVASQETAGTIFANNIVLAGGNLTGRLYESTNRAITSSVQELAFKSGASLVDLTVHMIHPFGMANAQGRQLLGCHETDQIADYTVYLDGLSRQPILDRETSELLRSHQAHYFFPEISRKFREFGSVVKLVNPRTDHQMYAKVAYHYGHMGIATEDGVTVRGLDNLYAIGDASGVGFWTNHRERFPGFALVKCLVDAEMLVSKVNGAPRPIEKKAGYKVEDRLDNVQPVQVQLQKEAPIKAVNTEHVHALIDDPTQAESISADWIDRLEALEVALPHSTLLQISKGIARAHTELATGVFEPLSVAPLSGSSELKIAS